MEIIKKIKDFTNKTGVKASIIVTSLSIIMLTSSLIGSEYDSDKLDFLCFFNIAIEFVFGILVTFNVIRNKQKYLHLLPFLFLNWFIGCFSTNIFINIFENLPIWVYATTFVFCFTNFVIYNNVKNRIISSLSFFINGISILLILYYVVYLLPFAPVSCLGIMALGMGFYGLAPMIVLASHSSTLYLIFRENKKSMLLFLAGITSVIISFIIFTLLLNNESMRIGKYSLTNSFDNIDNDLPNYIKISQHLQPNFLNEILLKKDIVYVSTDNFFQFRGFTSFGNMEQYNERKTHDPFINLAFLFINKLDLSDDERINILKSNFDKRLETEEQLWNGRDLFTKNIKEDVKIYADNRLAYTEITMNIACVEKNWGQGEAIYSFQLPEGSVATSLSLWVNGVERKGVLTTKEKAQAAYKQVVGVEYRDPSLMQWKEGNRVVVRVFPISYDLPRTFKCGFTTPLKVENNKMIYQSLNIKGPNLNKAKTISRIQMNGNEKFESDKNFELENGFYINNSRGLDDWKAEMAINKNAFTNAFVWKNKTYEINEIQTQKIAFAPSEIILDLNSSWTKDEVKSIINQQNKKYFVWINNQKRAINNSNYENIFVLFESLSYSLLPFYNLKENSLVVTKCSDFSANFEELETTEYLQKLKIDTKKKNIKVINIGQELNPFWQTIKEQKYVSYLKTNLKNCKNLINENQFMELKTAKNIVNIEPANIAIQQNLATEKTKNSGSNHIYRLYAFGKVLADQVEIQNDSLAQNKYVDLAKDANIVSPISSLIVLETDTDYKANGIEKNVDTLGNASINNHGAVPEPHEWALIIIGLTMLLVYYRKLKVA